MPLYPIPVSGPSITAREVEYVVNAVSLGWNAKAADYIHTLERTMCKMTGQAGAIACSSASGALHIAMLVCGLRPGDEVIIPEIADFSVAAAVLHTGAKPVFCDVEEQTLCMDVAAAEALVGARTRAVVPVHLFGQTCDMHAVMDMAKRRGLIVVEDAAQAFGASFNGIPAGGFGDLAVFSFHANKAVTGGEGGIILASNRALFERAARILNNGSSGGTPRVYNTAGYKYAMGNIQAALALAQLERLPEIVSQKRQIQTWYKEAFEGARELALLGSVAGRESSHLSHVVFIKDEKTDLETLAAKLRENAIGIAPLYAPLSGMPMFTRQPNQVAYRRARQGLILPGGHTRTREEIIYTADMLKALLRGTTASPTGWLKRQNDVQECLYRAKTEGVSLPFEHNGQRFELKALRGKDLDDAGILEALTRWRNDNKHVFLTQIRYDPPMIRNMFNGYTNRSLDYILFLIMQEDMLWGHMGLDDFDFKKQACVAESLLMEPGYPRGLPTAACEALYEWAGSRLGIRKLYNHVLASNYRVRMMASLEGFREINRTPLLRETTEYGTVYRPLYLLGHTVPDDYFVFSEKDL